MLLIVLVIEKKVFKVFGSYKYYVVWKQYFRKFREKIFSNINVKGLSILIYFYKLINVIYIFLNKMFWDKDEVIELESKLE